MPRLRSFASYVFSAILIIGLAFPATGLKAWAQDGGPQGSAAEDSPITLQEAEELYGGLVDGSDTQGIIITTTADAGLSLLDADAGSGSLAQDLAAAGLTVTTTGEDAKGNTIVAADLAEGESIAQAVAAAESIEGVAAAQPNYVYDLIDGVDAEDVSAQGTTEQTAEGSTSLLAATGMANDPYAQVSDANATYNQYYLYNASITDAWDTAHTQGSVTVATLDTGADITNEDLSDNVLTDLAWDSFNSRALYAGENPVGDPVGHGTSVAGIIAATADNATGIAGASFNAKLLPIKVWGDSASEQATTLSVVMGYEYLLALVQNGQLNDLRVINISLGSYNKSGSGSLNDELMHSVIETARSSYSIVTVCAGGNGKSSANTPYTTNIYPADFDECVSVTALNADGTNIIWSDYNAQKDISAPGASILSTKATLGMGGAAYSKSSGTSEASPIVASVFALLFAACPEATVDAAEGAVYASADAVNSSANDRSVPDANGVVSGSHGAIDAAAALELLQSHEEKSFTDVSWTDWYCQAVYYNSWRGIMNGVDRGSSFEPEGTLTRAEAAQVLYNYLGGGSASAPAATQLADVDQSQWYAAAINWVVSEGVMSGYGDAESATSFGPSDNLTREQLAKVIAVAADADTSTASRTKYDSLNGTQDASAWAVPYLVWATDKGVINGVSGTELDPQGKVTRAQLAQVTMNCLQGGVL